MSARPAVHARAAAAFGPSPGDVDFGQALGRGRGRGCGLLVLALAFDAKPLFVPALALIAIGALAPAWVWCAVRGASASAGAGRPPVVEDQPLQAKIEVHRSVLGLPGAEVIDPVTEARFALSGPLSPIRGGRRAVRSTSPRASRAAASTCCPSRRWRSSDPLELARVSASDDGAPQRDPGAAAGRAGQVAQRRARAALRRRRRRPGVGADGRGRPRRPAPVPRRDPGQPDPLAGAGARSAG